MQYIAIPCIYVDSVLLTRSVLRSAQELGQRLEVLCWSDANISHPYAWHRMLNNQSPCRVGGFFSVANATEKRTLSHPTAHKKYALSPTYNISKFKNNQKHHGTATSSGNCSPYSAMHWVAILAFRFSPLWNVVKRCENQISQDIPRLPLPEHVRVCERERRTGPSYLPGEAACVVRCPFWYLFVRYGSFLK